MNASLNAYLVGNWKIAIGQIIQDVVRDKNLDFFSAEPMTEEKRLKALLASTLYELSLRLKITNVPHWVTLKHTLDLPWFVSGIHNMHAMAVLESPISFKRNLVFVTKEFFMRV